MHIFRNRAKNDQKIMAKADKFKTVCPALRYYDKYGDRKLLKKMPHH